MTDRAQSGGTLPNACPFLALEEDRDRRSAVPDGRHRCYAESSPHPRALTYQESYCLSAAFPSCRSFLDWAARAAAEPVHGGSRPGGPASVPLIPIPAAHQVPPPPPQRAAPLPLVPAPVEPSATRLPPPPPTYSPPPAWQPPGAVREDPTTFTWATPPPWVAEPEMRSTASLPPTARPPLDAERPDPVAAPAGDPWLSEEAAPFETWPPGPPSPTQVTGTFGPRRAADGPQPPSTWPVEPVAIPVGAGPLPPAVPTGPGVPATPVAFTDPAVSAAPMASTAPVASIAPVAQPAPVAEPAPLAEPAPVASGAPSVAAPEAQPTPVSGPTEAAPASTERRQPSSRWLPSFLSREAPPADTDATTLPARTESGARAAGATMDPVPSVDTHDTDPTRAGGPDTWTAAAMARSWVDPVDGTGLDSGTVPVTAGPSTEAAGPGAAAPPDGGAEDAPGALAPRRRRPGVPVDADAPAAVGSQTSGMPRSRGSGEWNRSRTRVRTGWRRVMPGMVPPVALGAIVLFLAAATLFFMPGFFASGGATPTPAPTGDPALLGASGEPGIGAPETPEPGDPAFTIYKVARGDTLLDIARRFAVTQEQLVCTNRELRRNPNLLSIGQELRIPPQGYVCPSAQKTKKP